MKVTITIAAILMTTVLLAGCGEKKDDAQAWSQKVDEQTSTDMPVQATVDPGLPGGEVLETFDSGGYTYVRLKTAEGEIWAAGPEAGLAIGDVVILEGAMVMKQFRAASLDRTFEEIWFASGFGGAGIETTTNPHGGMMGMGGGESSAEVVTDFSDLSPATDGLTIAQVFADRTDLAGHRVKVRGRVTKSLSGIMGHNWLHLQDGSGDAASGDHDLTVTTDQMAQTGDTVLIEGVLAVDKDFGSGYFYSVIVEEASVTVEENM